MHVTPDHHLVRALQQARHQEAAQRRLVSEATAVARIRKAQTRANRARPLRWTHRGRR